MQTLLLMLGPVVAGPNAPVLPPAPAFGAPLPQPMLNAIAQEIGELNDALDADTDLSHVGEDEDAPEWTGSIFAGATFSEGNTEQTQASSRADAELRRDKDRISLLAFWNYASQVDQTTNESSIVERNVGWKAQYDYFFDEDTYGYANAAGFYDTQQQLDQRLTLGAGAGYQVFDEESQALGIEGGVAYVDEDYEGSASDEDYIAARFAYNYRQEVTETTTFEQNLESIFSLQNSDDIIVRLDSRLNVRMSEALTATAQWVLDYDNTPAAGAERADHRVSFGVTWEF